MKRVTCIQASPTRSSSPSQILSGQTEEFVHLLGISGRQADRCTPANLVHHRPDMLNVRGHPGCARLTAPCSYHYSTKSARGCARGDVGAPGASPEQLGPVVGWQQLGNFPLHSRPRVGSKEQRGCVDGCGVQGKGEKKRENRSMGQPQAGVSGCDTPAGSGEGLLRAGNKG